MTEFVCVERNFIKLFVVSVVFAFKPVIYVAAGNKTIIITINTSDKKGYESRRVGSSAVLI